MLIYVVRDNSILNVVPCGSHAVKECKTQPVPNESKLDKSRVYYLTFVHFWFIASNAIITSAIIRCCHLEGGSRIYLDSHLNISTPNCFFPTRGIILS